MQAQKGASKENKSRAAASLVRQKKNNMRQILGFVDNRPETASLNTLQRKIYGDIKTPGDMNFSATNGLLQRKINLSNATQFSPQSVVQLFDAGNGAQWHIHHEHIKLGNNQDSRVNFNDRSKKAIRKELGEKIDRYGLNVGGALAASFRACIDYINDNC